MKGRWSSSLPDLVSVFFILMFGVLAFIARFSGDTVSAIWYLLLATFAVVCSAERRL